MRLCSHWREMTVPARTNSSPAQGRFPQQDLQISRQPPRLRLVGADHHQPPAGFRRQGGGQLGPVDPAQPRDGGGTAAPLHGGGQRPRLRNAQQGL